MFPPERFKISKSAPGGARKNLTDPPISALKRTTGCPCKFESRPSGSAPLPKQAEKSNRLKGLPLFRGEPVPAPGCPTPTHRSISIVSMNAS